MDALLDAPDAILLLSLFERLHSGRQSFAISPTAMSKAGNPPWHRSRIERGRDVLLERGFLEEVTGPDARAGWQAVTV